MHIRPLIIYKTIYWAENLSGAKCKTVIYIYHCELRLHTPLYTLCTDISIPSQPFLGVHRAVVDRGFFDGQTIVVVPGGGGGETVLKSKNTQ